MGTVPELARLSMEEVRRGNLQAALGLAKKALVDHPRDHGLVMFVGMLHARRMELEEAATHFRRALTLAPSEPVARIELIRVLVGLNQLDQAEKLLKSASLRGVEPKRLKAMIQMRRSQFGDAARNLDEIVSVDQQDFESWGNLGVCRLRMGDARSAIEALTNSLRLRRDQERFRASWAEAHVQAGSGEEGLEIVRKAALTKRARDPLVRVTIARLEELLGRPEKAIEALEEALALNNRHSPALFALVRLHERQNQVDEAESAIAKLEALGEPMPDLQLLKAQLAFRRGELDLALELAQTAPDSFDPGTRAQLIGKIHDRLGNSAAAFDAFDRMNGDNGIARTVIEARAKAFQKSLDERHRTLSRQWVRRWPGSRTGDAGTSPIFLVGFPRSGTTLLDTLLMGHPQLCVSEEKPMLDSVARAIGGYERLGKLDEPKLAELRALYFSEAAKHVPDLGNRILVDKQPFAILEAPLIHRLFPNAKFLFAQRHPCDVVLSCFITRFEPNYGLSSFTTIEETAKVYNDIMRFWAKCRATLPLIVHLVRYERLVEEAEAEMRALLAFLGLEWDGRVLDHSSTASERGFINTPSYSQVVEPMYDRSIDRWKRYREQMEPVLALLEPWAAAMGYDT
jgi:tetratricopeptide (TPR) repeat protein